jgi:tetratricopeptide (TPR) repeat protein
MIARALAIVLALTAFGFAQEQPSEEIKQLMLTAQAKAQARDFQGALDAIVKVLELDPTLKPAWQASVQLRVALNDHEGVVSDLTKWIALDAENAGRLYGMRAGAKQQLKDYEGAAKDFSKAIEANAQDANSYWGRGRVKEMMGDLEGALKDFDSTCSIAAEFGQAYLQRAELYAALGKYDKAMEDYDNALFLFHGADQSGVYMARARTRLLKGDAKGVDEDIKQAMEAAPESAGTYFSRGLINFDRKKFKQAIADLRKHLELQPDGHEYGRLYICLARLALGEKEAGQKEMADYLEGREEKDDWFVSVASFLAGKLSEEDFLKAATDENAWTTREQNCEAYWYIGARAMVDGNMKKALEHMNLCVALKVHQFIEYQSSMVVIKREATKK